MAAEDKIFNAFIAGIIIIGIATVIVVLIIVANRGPLVWKPTQQAQVEVVEKDFWRSGGAKGAGSSFYIVSFKFSDNSVKDLRIKFSGTYDEIQEGDTGTLVFSEVENIESKFKNERERYDCRKFVSFEKDSN